MKKINLKNKLSLSVIAIIAVLGMTATYFVHFYTQGYFMDYEKEKVEIIVTEKSNQISSVMSYGISTVAQISNLQDVREYLLDTEVAYTDEHMLLHLNSYNISDIFSSVYLMDADGLTLASTNESFTGNNYSFRTYFQKALKGESSVDLALGVTSQKIGFYFSSPIFDEDDNFIGVAVAKLDSDILKNILELNSLRENTNIMLVDRFGVVAFSTDPAYTLMTLSELSEGELSEISNSRYYEGVELLSLNFDKLNDLLFEDNYSFICDFNDLYDLNSIAGIGLIDATSFHLVVMEGTENFEASVLNLAYLLALFVAFAALVAGLFIYIVIARLLSPLKILRASAQKIQSGDFSSRVNLKHGGELGMLGDAFNSMMDVLKDERDAIEKQIKSQTDKLRLQTGELEDRQMAMMNILEDIADEKKVSEIVAQDLKKFKMAVDGASDHIILTDPDGIVVYGNPAVEKITGYSLKNLMGLKVGTKKLWGGMMGMEFYEKLWDTIKVQKKIFSGELLNKRKNGDMYESATTISPILNKDGEILFFLGIERDITVEKNIERAKSDFVSLASHQLRTPLTAIRWYLDLMLDGDTGKLTKEQVEYLNTIKDSNIRMVNLVNSLLNVSRLELGTFSVDPEKVDLIKLIKTEIKGLEINMTAKNLELSEEYDSTISELSLDKNLTSIVVQNLISNSVKYTKEGDKVSVSAYQGGEKGEQKKELTHVIFKVQDTGGGIPDSQKHRIFEKMFRADNARAIDPEGNGLGLYMVKQIVEETGGKIWFESEEGVGTTFYVAFSKKGMQKKEGTKKLTPSSIAASKGKDKK